MDPSAAARRLLSKSAVDLVVLDIMMPGEDGLALCRHLNETTELPVIPTTTAADWFEYNSQRFTGWPTKENPYDSGQPSGNNNGPGTGSDEVVLLHLRPAS